MLHPLEPRGYEIVIDCSVAIGAIPGMRDLKKGSPIRVRARISKATSSRIELAEPHLELLKADDVRGTRVEWLFETIRAELGEAVSPQVSDATIGDSVKAQIAMGRVAGYMVHEGRWIRPEIPERSPPFKLLVLYTCKQLLQTSPVLRDRHRQGRVLEIDSEIHNLENYG
jgi:hypothetical protein